MAYGDLASPNPPAQVNQARDSCMGIIPPQPQPGYKVAQPVVLEGGATLSPTERL
jgi:hypothetical protein